MNEKENADFRHVQEILGTLMLALNWPGWTDQERAALLLDIDSLERKLRDMRE